MPEVNVEINGRKYRMACEDGQEDHLRGLAARFNEQVNAFKGDFGEIGDNRLTVMAGIAVLDSLAEVERKLARVQDELDEALRAGQSVTRQSVALERRFADQLTDVARQIDLASSAIETISGS
jgi:cell division protein ZapA